MGGRFKSYYVVWKQEAGTIKEQKVEMFKSYYVVWKRFFASKPAPKKIKFKSYYVVWKLRKKNNRYREYKSLNRTM